MPIVTAAPESIARAARLLRDGQLVAFPTETVYGLGADASNGEAVARIYEAKGRPRFNPLIAHVADLAAAKRIAVLEGRALLLAEAFWPGPLTLVLPRRSDGGVCDLATAGLDTVGVRIPDHPVALALLSATGRPVAAPSANRSGHVSPTTAHHVEADLGSAPAMILDGGPCRHGLESTILDASGEKIVILRAGAITADAIEACLGEAILRCHTSMAGSRPSSPGQLASHYAPKATMRLEVVLPEPDEALLAFGPAVPSHHGPVVNLSATGDLVEAAANLFAALRQLDTMSAARIAVMPIPGHGLGVAINDRLQRAAAPRPAEDRLPCD